MPDSKQKGAIDTIVNLFISGCGLKKSVIILALVFVVNLAVSVFMRSKYYARSIVIIPVPSVFF